MRSVIFFCLITICSVAIGGVSNHEEKQLVKFIEKNQSCRIAIANVSGGQVINPVFCVWDGVTNEGTIHESKGCFLGRFDVDTAKYSPMSKTGMGLQARSQPDGPCSADLIVKMLTKYPFGEYSSFDNSKEPVLAHLKRQSKEFGVIYDPEKLLTPELVKQMEQWQPSKKSAKAKKRVDCNNISSDEDDVNCSTPDQIYAQVCNMHSAGASLEIRKSIYKVKTGKSLPECKP
jgi:serine/threonine protein kinase